MSNAKPAPKPSQLPMPKAPDLKPKPETPAPDDNAPAEDTQAPEQKDPIALEDATPEQQQEIAEVLFGLLTELMYPDDGASQDAASQAPQMDPTQQAPGQKPPAPKPSASSPQKGSPGMKEISVKEVDGQVRWVALCSGSYGPDRDGQWVTEKALQDWVSTLTLKEGVPVRKNGEEIVARWHHMGNPDPLTKSRGFGIDLGIADTVEYVDHTLVISGPFDDPDLGRALGKETHTTGNSIGFFHPKSEPQDGEFHHIDIFEVSFLPDDRASYPLTVLSVVEGA